MYISHRLEEVFQLADRACVLRDGKHIITLPISEIDKAGLIRYMVGRELGQDYPEREKELGDEVLRVEALTNRRVKHCSVSVRAGEIVGFAGLVGAGRTELARAIFGADPVSGGKVYLRGKELKIHCPQDAIRCGIGLITEDQERIRGFY